MENVYLGLSGWQWVDLGGSLAVVLGVMILGRWFFRLILGRLLPRLTAHTRTTLDDLIFDALLTPAYLLAIVFALDFAVGRLDFVPLNWADWLADLFYSLYLITAFIIAGRVLNALFVWYGREISIKTNTDLDDQLLPFFRRVALSILGLIGIIMLLGYFDVEVGAMLTTLGIGSLAIALAAQAALSDTISGFIIMIDRPFRIGDRIQIQDLNTWGDVVDIGLRSSRIRTRDNRMVVVPNSVIGKSLIVNYAYPDTKYRIDVNVGVAYGTDLEKARQVMIEAVRKVPGVLDAPHAPGGRDVEALFLEFGASALVFKVRWWIDSYADTRRMYDKVNTAIYNALQAEGIVIPFQQVDVHLFKGVESG